MVSKIAITGDPGIGKTTLIQNVCSDLKYRKFVPYGFYTKELKSNGQRIGFDLNTFTGSTVPLARIRGHLQINEFRQRKEFGKWVVNVSILPEIAVPALENIPDNGILIIDEIGKMELFDETFVKTVKSILKFSQTPVIITIPTKRSMEHELLVKIRNDPSIKIIKIDRSNRSDPTLLKKILNDLCSREN